MQQKTKKKMEPTSNGSKIYTFLKSSVYIYHSLTFPQLVPRHFLVLLAVKPDPRPPVPRGTVRGIIRRRQQRRGTRARRRRRTRPRRRPAAPSRRTTRRRTHGTGPRRLLFVFETSFVQHPGDPEVRAEGASAGAAAVGTGTGRGHHQRSSDVHDSHLRPVHAENKDEH